MALLTQRVELDFFKRLRRGMGDWQAVLDFNFDLLETWVERSWSVRLFEDETEVPLASNWPNCMIVVAKPTGFTTGPVGRKIYVSDGTDWWALTAAADKLPVFPQGNALADDGRRRLALDVIELAQAMPNWQAACDANFQAIAAFLQNPMPIPVFATIGSSGDVPAASSAHAGDIVWVETPHTGLPVSRVGEHLYVCFADTVGHAWYQLDDVVSKSAGNSSVTAPKSTRWGTLITAQSIDYTADGWGATLDDQWADIRAKLGPANPYEMVAEASATLKTASWSADNHGYCLASSTTAANIPGLDRLYLSDLRSGSWDWRRLDDDSVLP